MAKDKCRFATGRSARSYAALPIAMATALVNAACTPLPHDLVTGSVNRGQAPLRCLVAASDPGLSGAPAETVVRSVLPWCQFSQDARPQAVVELAFTRRARAISINTAATPQLPGTSSSPKGFAYTLKLDAWDPVTGQALANVSATHVTRGMTAPDKEPAILSRLASLAAGGPPP